MLHLPQSETVLARWQRISSWMGDDSPLSQTFRRQLGEATGWSPSDCLAAIEEYRRFCLIAAIHGEEVSPSPEIDKVWHLHLTYSIDYWKDFCPHRLGYELHHQPGLGQPGEAARLRHVYGLTLQRYAALFGFPPERWWPTHTLLQRRRAGRGWLRQLWPRATAGLAALLGVAALAEAMPANPLDWQGPEFLGLFFALMLIAALLTAVLRYRLTRGTDRAAGMALGEPDVWTVAYLSGGPQRVIDAAVAHLHEKGFIRWNDSSKRAEPTEQGEPDDPLLRTVLAAARQHRATSLVNVVKSAHIESIRRNLKQRGWWFTAEQASNISRVSALPFAVLAGFGVLKIGVGLSRDKPVLLLALLTVACAVLALILYFKRVGVTAAGRKAFADIKQRQSLTARAHTDQQVAMAVALAGTTVLAGTALAGYHDFRRPSGGSDSGGGAGCSSCSSGGDGGGGGCGGCGGD